MKMKSDIFKDEDSLLFLSRCSMDFRFFSERVLELEIKPFHMEWVNAFRYKRFSCIEAPRGHGKTELLSVAFPIWVVMFNQSKKFLVVSKSIEQSVAILRRIRDYIEDNELLKDLIPLNRNKSWTKTEMNTSTGCKIYCKPLGFKGSTARGEHVDYLLCDEAGTYDNKNLFYSVLAPMVEFKNGHIMVMGTPESRHDLLSELQRNTNYFRKIYKAIISVDGHPYPLWPEKFSLEKLEEFRKSNGDFAFNREYLCNPISRETSLYPYEMIEDCTDEHMMLQDKGIAGGAYFHGYDFAMSAAYHGDYSVFVVINKRSDGKYVIEYLFRAKGMNSTLQEEKLVEIQKLFRPVRALGDESTFGRTIIDNARALGASIEGFTFQDKRIDLLENLRSILDQRKLIFPVHPHDPKKADMQTLIKELTEMTSYENTLNGKTNYKSVGMHDDCVMALALAVKAASEQRSIIEDIGIAHSPPAPWGEPMQSEPFVGNT